MAAWTIKRDDHHFSASSLPELRQWAREGRVLPSDLIYHPTLERWIYAREVGELDVSRSSKAQSNGRGLAWFGFLLLLVGGFAYLAGSGTAGVFGLAGGALLIVVGLIISAVNSGK